jgi:hypothetical protein
MRLFSDLLWLESFRHLLGLDTRGVSKAKQVRPSEMLTSAKRGEGQAFFCRDTTGVSIEIWNSSPTALNKKVRRSSHPLFVG